MKLKWRQKMQVKDVITDPNIIATFGDNFEKVGKIQIENEQIPINEIITAYGFSIEYRPYDSHPMFDTKSKKIFINDTLPIHTQHFLKGKILGFALLDPNYQEMKKKVEEQI